MWTLTRPQRKPITAANIRPHTRIILLRGAEETDLHVWSVHVDGDRVHVTTIEGWQYAIPAWRQLWEVSA